jgi:predicted anti-sigma-YlaC factor YlaD
MEEQKDICADYRAAFELQTEQLGADQSLELDRHAQACSRCRQWTKQVNSAEQYIQSLPQFDVPESATQRVLVAVGHERKFHLIREGILLPAVLVASCLILFLVPVDSVDGACSWLMCAAIAAAFGTIVRGTGTSSLEVHS